MFVVDCFSFLDLVLEQFAGGLCNLVILIIYIDLMIIDSCRGREVASES